MDRERAIEILNNLTFNLDFEDGTSEKDIDDIEDAINMAIEALAILSMLSQRRGIGNIINVMCGASRPPLFDNYCPYCGAKMFEPQENYDITEEVTRNSEATDFLAEARACGEIDENRLYRECTNPNN